MRAVYPGSFDPITKGHLDIIDRASKIADDVIIGVLVNSNKNPLFTSSQRVEMIRECTAQYPNVHVEAFDGLTINFCRKHSANVIIRGLRAVTDFESEMQIAQTNHVLQPAVETLFFTTSLQYAYLSSTIAKEVSKYGSDVSSMVPPNVVARMKEKFGMENN